jgi:ABC-2 type transport system permease protein
MRKIWTLARMDLMVWARSPWAVLAAVIPPIAMAIVLVMLSNSVGKQPVALVVAGHGPQAAKMAKIIESDDDAYVLTRTSAARAKEMLGDQRVVGVITVPADFDAAVARHRGTVDLELNNVDIDFSDDIRRATARSVARFNAPALGFDEDHPSTGNPQNVYHIGIAESDLRETDVEFLDYQVQPVLILLVISLGLLGSAVLVSRDFERGTAKLLLLAPAARLQVILGRILGGTLAALAVLIPLVALAVWHGNLDPPPGHWPQLIALLGAVTVMSVGLGVLLGVWLKRSQLVALGSVIASTYLFFLGGGFTTIAFLPDWLQTISRLVPTRYAIDGVRQVLFYPNLQGFGHDMAMLLGFAAATTVLGAVALRKSYE